MNVLRRELSSGVRSLLAWTGVVAGLNLLMLVIFPTFADRAAELDQFIKLFPPAMIRMFGLDQLSMSDLIGYYATEVYILVSLFGAIFATMLGAGILAKEEDEKTIEFLLARPIRRSAVLVQKALAFTVCIAAFNGVVLLANLAGAALWVTQEYSRPMLVQLSIAPFFSQLCLASIGFLLALAYTRRRAVYSVSIGLAMGTYIAGMVSLVSERLDWLRWFSPFRYVEASEIVARGGINPSYAAALVAISLLSIFATIALYGRRDITV